MKLKTTNVYYNAITGVIDNQIKQTDAQRDTHLLLNPTLEHIATEQDVIKSVGGKYSVDVDTKALVYTADAQNSHHDHIAKLRSQRDRYLKATDWTQLSDCPLTTKQKSSYATYRQQLRDLPAQHSDLEDYAHIVWPTKPGAN